LVSLTLIHNSLNAQFRAINYMGFIQIFVVVIENALIHIFLQSVFQLKEKIAIMELIISHSLFHYNLYLCKLIYPFTLFSTWFTKHQCKHVYCGYHIGNMRNIKNYFFTQLNIGFPLRNYFKTKFRKFNHFEDIYWYLWWT
jgi:hypothetical protein